MPVDPKTASEAEIKWRREHRSGVIPKILRDVEVKALIDENIETHTYEELIKACIERFGKGRAPSRGALSRYWNRTRNVRDKLNR